MKSTIFDLRDWKKAELHPKRADVQAVDWIFFVDALNFSFWPDEDKTYSVSYKGVPYTGNDSSSNLSIKMIINLICDHTLFFR
jgi:hypothetical protein